MKKAHVDSMKRVAKSIVIFVLVILAARGIYLDISNNWLPAPILEFDSPSALMSGWKGSEKPLIPQVYKDLRTDFSYRMKISTRSRRCYTSIGYDFGGVLSKFSARTNLLNLWVSCSNVDEVVPGSVHNPIETRKKDDTQISTWIEMIDGDSRDNLVNTFGEGMWWIITEEFSKGMYQYHVHGILADIQNLNAIDLSSPNILSAKAVLDQIVDSLITSSKSSDLR